MLDFEIPGWHEEAACVGETWVGDLHGSSPATAKAKGKALCAACPVFDACDAWASANGPQVGMWAGRIWMQVSADHPGKPIKPPRAAKPRRDAGVRRRKRPAAPAAPAEPPRKPPAPVRLPPPISAAPGPKLPAVVSHPNLDAETYARLYHGMTREDLLTTLLAEQLSYTVRLLVEDPAVAA